MDSRYFALVYRLPQDAGQSADEFFQYVKRVGDQDGAQRRATDNQQFRRLQKHAYVAVLHQIATDDGPDNHDDSDNHEHDLQGLALGTALMSG